MRENPKYFDKIFSEMITYYCGYVDSIPDIDQRTFGLIMVYSFQNYREIVRLQKTNLNFEERISKLEKELMIKEEGK